MGKPREHFANPRPADAENLAHLVLAQARARWQLLPADRGVDLVVDEVVPGLVPSSSRSAIGVQGRFNNTHCI